MIEKNPDMARDVREFRERMGQPCPERPVGEEEREWDFLSNELVIEEYREWNHSTNLTDEADALIDLVYVAIGRLWALGVDPAPVWRMVHEANMAKAGAPRRADGKVLKPAEGWQHPDIAAEIERQRREGDA